MADRAQGSTTRNPQRAILLTCYMTGAPSGKNLGVAGYSYDFVAQLFIPLLEKFGKVIPVHEPETRLNQAAQEARRSGFDPVHVSFLPLQDMPFCDSCPNVAVPAWEFPEIPNQAFGGNPQNDWPTTANRCASVWVGGAFTEEAFLKAGTKCSVEIVPVPTPDSYFDVPLWQPDQSNQYTACAYPLPLPKEQLEQLPQQWVGPRGPTTRWKQVGKSLERRVRRAAKRIMGPMYELVRAPSQAIRNSRTSLTTTRLPIEPVSQLDLSGVVYTSILNPIDGRKNWTDLLNAYLLGLADCPDATLVVKLITGSQQELARVLRFTLGRDIDHRCKLYFLTGFLTEAEMAELARCSTYYVQTTKAEGNCLPLMNYLAAGRPAITPVHSAIGDYFRSDHGFPVESHPEPAAWPHDRQLRTRTSWARLVWPSIVEQLRASYHTAKYDLPTYYRMANAARSKMATWASNDAVLASLQQAFATLDRQQRTSESAAPLRRAA